MHKLVFECETITPMFLAGADGKTPELRAPSIKGALRFWWRAMNGNLKENLLENEGKLFGCSEEKIGRSKIIVKVKEITKEVNNNFKDLIWDYNRRVPKSGYEGISYLFYSTVMQQRPYFQKLNFNILLQSSKKEDLKKAGYIFWIFAMFGGIGTRARRGGGNFQVSSLIDPENIINDISFNTNPKEKIDIKFYLESNFKKIKVNFNLGTDIEYANLASAKVYYLNPYDKWTISLNSLGTKFQQFRTRSSPDYESVKEYITTGNINNPIEKAILGLPLSYRYRSLETSDGKPKSALIEGSKEDFQRSASPIFFRIIKFQNKYYPVILIFDKKLLPDDVKLKIKENTSKTKDRKQRPTTIEQPSNTIIQDFIDTIISKTEVSL